MDLEQKAPNFLFRNCTLSLGCHNQKFVGNLSQDVDENLLYDTFSSFGTLIRQPRIMRDEVSNESKGSVYQAIELNFSLRKKSHISYQSFGFVSFDCFESSDNAIECMNGQFLGNRQIGVQYAFKKDTAGEYSESAGRPSGSALERHGSRAERMLAAQRQSQHRHQSKMPQISGSHFNPSPSHSVLPGMHAIPPPPPPASMPLLPSTRPPPPPTSFPPPPPPPS